VGVRRKQKEQGGICKDIWSVTLCCYDILFGESLEINNTVSGVESRNIQKKGSKSVCNVLLAGGENETKIVVTKFRAG
jgi:hypothetical protein